MTERERLIALLDGKSTDTPADVEYVADCLLESGVIVPPCKVGDTVWFVQDKRVYEGRIILIRPFIHKDHTNFHGNVLYECINPFYNDGRTMEHQISVVFQEYGQNTIAYLSREEAEKALAERKVNNGLHSND